MFQLSQIKGFDWDQGNVNKNWIKHKVSIDECEMLFITDTDIVILDDQKHSIKEIRHSALGKINNRYLFISFTVRDNKIRVISARDTTKKEKTNI